LARTDSSSASATCFAEEGYVVPGPDLFARRDGDHKTLDTCFGAPVYVLRTTGPQPLITQKKVVPKSDYIHHGINIYHF
jgi:hypothetical protein